MLGGPQSRCALFWRKEKFTSCTGIRTPECRLAIPNMLPRLRIRSSEYEIGGTCSMHEIVCITLGTKPERKKSLEDPTRNCEDNNKLDFQWGRRIRTGFICLGTGIGERLLYTGCPRRNVQYFGRVFLMLNYTDITQNTYIQSWTVTEIMAREVWNFDSCYTLIDYQIHIKTGRNMWFL